MGNNVKKLAKIYLMVGLVISVILLFSGLTKMDDLDCIGYATIFGGSVYGSGWLETAGNNALSGIVQIIMSISLAISAALAYFPLAAFGELVESTKRIEEEVINRRHDTAQIDAINQVNKNLEVVIQKMNNISDQNEN